MARQTKRSDDEAAKQDRVEKPVKPPAGLDEGREQPAGTKRTTDTRGEELHEGREQRPKGKPRSS